jgi:molybdate transport system ATP-binding protein
LFLEVQDLSVNLGEFHLDAANLKLEKNDYMVIIGPTGSGKSVLLETIAGFYSPHYGRIFLDGLDITNLSPENRDISIVYQDYVLFPHMNVFENIIYGLKKKNSDKVENESKVEEMARLLKINHLLERDPRTLSGGEKQRTAIARSLVVEPKILLMDEPFSALDVNTHSYLTDLIKKAIADYETTCIHVSHNFNDVWSLAEQVAVMKDGVILQQGIVTDVFSKPSYDFVADFVGVQNVFEGDVLGREKGVTSVKLKNGQTVYSSESYSSDSKKVMVAIRPENIIFSNETFISSIRNQINGTIDEIIQVGPVVWIEVKVGDISFKGMLTPSSCEKLGIKTGKEIYISFKSINVKILEGEESYNSI